VAISPVSPLLVSPSPPSLPSFLPTPPAATNAFEKATIWAHETMAVNFPHMAPDYTLGRPGKNPLDFAARSAPATR